MERASRTVSALGPIVLVVLLVSAFAQAGEVDPVQGRIAILKDLQQPDSVRCRVAKELAQDYKLLRSGGPEALVALGKETTDENMQLQIAVAISNMRGSAGDTVAKDNLELFSKWLVDGKDNALRYWAAILVARAQNQAAADTLAKVLEGLDPKTEKGLRSSVIAAMASLEGTLGAKAEDLLLKLSTDKQSELRIEGVEGLRKRKRDKPSVEVIDRLLELSKTDKDEAVWRCAVLALREVAPSSLRSGLNIAAGAPEDERQSTLKTWERRWVREKKQILAAEGAKKE